MVWFGNTYPSTSGEVIPSHGALVMDIAYGSHMIKGCFLVVKGAGLSLLGCDWLRKIKLNRGEIKPMRGQCAGDVIKKYPDVIGAELSTLQGVTLKLSIDPNATPRFIKPTAVPCPIVEKAEKGLERL